MSVLWPPTASGAVDPSTLTWYPGSGRWVGWMTPEVARSLPGIARGVSLITGQAMQMPLEAFRGDAKLPRPRLLDAPDPDQSRAWFVGVQWEDYLYNGNALHYVTTRDAFGWPASVVWLPAAWVNIVKPPATQDNPSPEVEYWVGQTRLRREDVVHVKRGSDRSGIRGVGVVEQHLDALGTVRDQHRYESEVLKGAAVPSVAVIAPNPRLSSDEASEAKIEWLDKYGGPEREPAILPAGSQVIPLSWSPSDSQLVEARQLALTDAANMLNLDGYWLGSPSSSHTYRSPGPMYLNMLKQTLAPILAVFEDVWSGAWLPRGQRVRHDRRAVLTDDMATMVRTAREAVDAGLWTVEEGRAYMGLAPEIPAGTLREPTKPAAIAPAPDTDDSSTDTEEQIA